MRANARLNSTLHADEGSQRPHLKAWLAAIAGFAAIPRILAGLSDPISYDGYWHVFIARNLPREWRSLAHPPLFPLLLRLSDAIQHSRPSYEAISLVTGTVAVFLFGRVLQTVRTCPSITLLGALAFGLSPTAIRMSAVVESYMLCVVFILAAFVAYLDLLAPRPDAPGRSRLAFATLSTLALLSHYVAGLFLVACIAAPLLIALIWPEYRREFRRALPDRLGADVATMLLPAAVGLTLYLALARPWVRSLNHLPEFYFRPGTETAWSYLTRNLGNTFNLFSPIRVAVPGASAALFAVFTIGALILSASWGDPAKPAARMAPSLIFGLLLVFGMGAGLLGKYPFGGATRHQLLLMIFGLLAALVALSRIIERATATGRRALIAICSIAVAGNTFENRREWWTSAADPFKAEVRRFEEAFPQASEVDVDQFNLVGFFAQRHDWQWTFIGSAIGHPQIQRYALSHGNRKLTLVAHRGIWNMDFLDPGLYDALAESPRRDVSSRSFVVFCVHQVLPGSPSPDSDTLARKIPLVAAPSGLEVERLIVEGADVYGSFRTTSLPNSPPPFVSSIVPSETKVRTGFQVQPDGSSAISVFGTRFQRGAAVLLGERPLDTTFGNAGWVTAVVPREVYARPGKLPVRVLNPDGRSSNAVTFLISP